LIQTPLVVLSNVNSIVKQNERNNGPQVKFAWMLQNFCISGIEEHHKKKKIIEAKAG
jgi:hypothetical protein